MTAAHSGIVDDWAMAYFEIYLPVLIFDGLRSEWLANGQVFPRECQAAIGNVTPWTELALDPAGGYWPCAGIFV